MRLYVKKVLLLCTVLVLLWFVVTYSSLVEVPKTLSNSNSLNSDSDLETKINDLDRKMEKSLSDSNRLLESMKQHLKKIKMDKVIEYENGDSYNQNLLQDVSAPVLPVLVIACDRITVKRCIENLVKFRPSKETFPIIISQDCGHNATYQVIKSFTDDDPSITVVKQPDLSEIPLPRTKVKFRGYYKISRHYKFALHHVLVTLGHQAVIIVEDDLDISPDFFEYFLGTYPLLVKDPSIWCISAWNDNGKKELIEASRPSLLHRTDFFPGLGWMLRRESWLRLEPHWPQGFFDDWLRNPENTEGRACIRPEISRTYSFGKIGVSRGLFFDMHLRFIQLNMEYVEFTKLNLTYLIKEKYDVSLSSEVYSLPELTAQDVMTSPVTSDTAAVRVPYSNAQTYQRAARKLGLMDDFRSGIPRTAYRGIVSCFVRGRRVYLAPDFEWIKYDPAWG